MNLYLLRHAIAVEAEQFSGKDSERPLTRQGEKKMRRIALGMKALELSFDVILSSPYRRAQETTAIVTSKFKVRRGIQLTDSLAPEGSREALVAALSKIAKHAEDVMLVGHEPYLSTFAAELVFGIASPGLNLKKGGLCKLRVDQIHTARCAKLDWVLTPRQLIALAD